MGQKLKGKQSAFVYWLKSLRRAKESQTPVLLRWVALIYEVYLVQYVQFARKFRIIYNSKGEVKDIVRWPVFIIYNKGQKLSWKDAFNNQFPEGVYKMHKRNFEYHLFNRQVFDPSQRPFLYAANVLATFNKDTIPSSGACLIQRPNL